MSIPKPSTIMTDAEAEALYHAACQGLKQMAGTSDEEATATLRRAISKLRRASTLIIEQED